MLRAGGHPAAAAGTDWEDDGHCRYSEWIRGCVREIPTQPDLSNVSGCDDGLTLRDLSLGRTILILQYHLCITTPDLPCSVHASGGNGSPGLIT